MSKSGKTGKSTKRRKRKKKEERYLKTTSLSVPECVPRLATLTSDTFGTICWRCRV
jgi:hypothetical protein